MQRILRTASSISRKASNASTINLSAITTALRAKTRTLPQPTIAPSLPQREISTQKSTLRITSNAATRAVVSSLASSSLKATPTSKLASKCLISRNNIVHIHIDPNFTFTVRAFHSARGFLLHANKQQQDINNSSKPDEPKDRHEQPPENRHEQSQPDQQQQQPQKPEKPEDKKDEQPSDGKDKKVEEKFKNLFTASSNETNIMIAVFLACAGLALIISTSSPTNKYGEEISFTEFKTKYLDAGLVSEIRVVNDTYAKVYLKKDQVGGKSIDPPAFFFRIDDPKYLEEVVEEMQQAQGVPINNRVAIRYSSFTDWGQVLLNFLPMALIIGLIFFNIRRTLTSGGGGIFNINKTKAQFVNSANSKVGVTFKDVAGMAEAKREITEFVSFLKEPERFKKLGAKIPRGAILMGPPGTGKTLLAKAVAGESKVPFFSISGSEFVEMFVGVGPARVRDLFAKAREHRPCIVYIDEIDAIARPRGKSGYMGGNDERENTLNQLLVEMDGFNTLDNQEVIVLASTNVDLEQLDKALMRPGRFDRQILVDNPDIKDRIEIYKVHLQKLKLNPDATDWEKKKSEDGTEQSTLDGYAERLASLTPGFSGADIANVCNEGAIIAARSDKKFVELIDLEKAIDRVIGGLEKKNRVLSPKEKRIVAYHEAGHAVVSWFLKHCDPLLKITIVPRGASALGYAQYMPKEEFIKTKEQFDDTMCMALGGRAAEMLMFNHLSTGAQDDLARVTRMAYSQVSTYGWSSDVGPLSFPIPGSQEMQLQKPYSEHTATVIDKHAKSIVDAAIERTLQLLRERKDELEKVAQYLLKHENMNQQEFEKLVGPRPT